MLDIKKKRPFEETEKKKKIIITNLTHFFFVNSFSFRLLKFQLGITMVTKWRLQAQFSPISPSTLPFVSYSLLERFLIGITQYFFHVLYNSMQHDFLSTLS